MATADDGVSTTQAEPGSQRIQVRRAALASAIGTTIEWYDFFLYNTAAALVFPHLFFPASSTYAGAMQSFATYFVGFAARPIGAAIFGHWGDRTESNHRLWIHSPPCCRYTTNAMRRAVARCGGGGTRTPSRV